MAPARMLPSQDGFKLLAAACLYQPGCTARTLRCPSSLFQEQLAPSRKIYTKARIATFSGPTVISMAMVEGGVHMKILIADDKRHIRQELRQLIEGREGWDVCAEAEDGVQAVNRAKQFKPDLVILDLALPELNGFEAADQISNALPGVPILMLTLYASSQVEKEAARVGVQRVISKSTAYMLVPAIEEALARVHHEKTA